MISQQIIDKIFDAAAIEDVVGEFVTLKKAGANYKGLCPFHDDKHPSMSVSPSKGIFKCFSCGQGGNVFQFIMEHEGLSYPLSIKYLAQKYNIPIEEEQLNLSEMEEEARKKDGIYSCLEFAKKYFISKLNDTQDGKVIYKPYLSERGLNQVILDEFHVGLSGTSRSELLQQGLNNSYSSQQMFDAGLVKKIDENQGVIESNLRDTFIERIVFPIYNISGKVLGFGGRIIKTDVKAPKYLNSPETLVYEKRKQLYGLYQSKNSIRTTDECYVVEGYMDVVSLYQAGIKNVVAVSGTAFTPEQAKLIKRFAAGVVLLFDGDEAGLNASLKHISTLLTADLNINLVVFPEGEDPDSYVQANGLSAFQEYVDKHRQSFVEFIATMKLGNGPKDPVKIADAARTISENIAQIPDPLKRAAYISQAAKLLEWEERILNEETNRFRIQNNQNSNRSRLPEYVPNYVPFEIPEEPKDEKNYQEYELLKSLILFSDRPFDEEQSVANFVFQELIEEEIWPISEYKEIFDEAYRHFQEHEALDQQFFIRLELSNKISAEVVTNKYSLSTGWEKNYEKFVSTEEDNYKKQVIENLNYLKLQRVEQAIEENQELMKEAEEQDITTYQHIHLNLQELKRKITSEIGAVVLK